MDNVTIDEGSAKGYNPNKRGRNSHHPLMAFVGQTRMVANAWLRPGNTADSSSCKLFMQETFDRALKGKKIGLVRADSGFYNEELLSYLEEEQHKYIIAVRMYPNVKSEVWGLGESPRVHRGLGSKVRGSQAGYSKESRANGSITYS